MARTTVIVRTGSAWSVGPFCSWLHLGYIGSMDERGFLKVTGRVKDMIIRGGMNVYSAEVEAALEDHPAILTAAVIGVPDNKSGEQVAAVLNFAQISSNHW